MNKYDEYEQAIRGLGQIIALDHEISNAEAVKLFDFMKRSGELAIKMLSGKKHRAVKQLFRKVYRPAQAEVGE